VGLSPDLTPGIGWFELAFAAALCVRPTMQMLLVATSWKLASESLFLFAHAPIWEFVERAGSYAAPLALALVLARQLPESQRA
jgi:hypothetical protein